MDIDAIDSGLTILDLSGPDESVQDAIEQANERAIEVYREVWHEFYEWEADYCRQIISFISASPTIGDDPEQHFVDRYNNIFEPRDLDNGDAMAVGTEDTMTVHEYHEDGTASQTTLSFRDIPQDNFEPYPFYISFTPVKQNWDERHLQNLEFIPYADDPSFQAVDYAQHYEVWNWISEKNDPDSDVIQHETARRLHFIHGFTLEDINRLEIIEKLYKGSRQGLLWWTSQRDMNLPWPGSRLSPAGDQQLPGPHDSILSYAPEDLRSRLDYQVARFCSSLNCLQFNCSTHNKTVLTSDQPDWEARKPKVTNTQMLSVGGEPCGESCFRHMDDLLMETIHWSDGDFLDLETVLAVAPDTIPCDLAVICRKPCREIFYQRAKLFPNEPNLDFDQEPRDPSRSRHLKFRPNDKEAPPPPCHHKGPCNVTSGCHCFKSSRHCQRGCRCDTTCERRWKGCKCNKSHYPCSSEKCPCKKMKRECDPEVCKSCRANSRHGCRNVQIQRGVAHRVEIKGSQWGLGAFSTQSIRSGDLIGEYLGGILHKNSDLTPAFTIAIDHIGLNYIFALDEEENLDAIRMGNFTRFLNHSPHPNCNATVMEVDGVRRIGLYAIKNIKARDELFLDYGDDYWDAYVKRAEDAIF